MSGCEGFLERFAHLFVLFYAMQVAVWAVLYGLGHLGEYLDRRAERRRAR